MDQNDREVAELMAGPTERLPTEAEEAEIDALRRDTPVTMQYEEMEKANKEHMFHQTFRYEMVKTDINIVLPTLKSAYPNEDFDSPLFQRMDIHKYLSDEVTRREFFIANNQWQTKFARYPKNEPIRMRKGVITKEHKVYHKECKEDFTISSGFTKALITVETSNVDEFFDCVINEPDLFFCDCCQRYIFDEIEYYNDNQFAIPDIDIWPECKHILLVYGDDDNDYVSLMAHQLIGIVVSCFSEEPPKKKICRRLDFDE
jgi:hypothetical protein